MRGLCILIALFLCVRCGTPGEVLRVSRMDQVRTFTAGTKDNCTDPLSYIPDSHYYTQYIRVNVHFMDDSVGDKNFTLEEGRKFMTALISNANLRLRENHKMHLPEGNNTPALNPKYQYRITPSGTDPDDDGFYRHFDPELYYFLNKGRFRNNYDRTVIDKYKIGADTILNIFVLPHHEDSLKSSTYTPVLTGIAMGNALKMSGLHERKEKPWESATLLNHEVGHILGLSHAWLRNDGCDDTPTHPNCWEEKDIPPCDGPVSNNMMDYNNSQMAITPCQLGIIHKGFATENSLTRKLLEPRWCNRDATRDIVIRDTVSWTSARDLRNNLVISEDAVLEIRCRVSMPPGGRITLKPGARLFLSGARLHNACGKKWEGIFMENKSHKKAAIFSTANSTLEDITTSNGM